MSFFSYALSFSPLSSPRVCQVLSGVTTTMQTPIVHPWHTLVSQYIHTIVLLAMPPARHTCNFVSSLPQSLHKSFAQSRMNVCNMLLDIVL